MEKRGDGNNDEELVPTLVHSSFKRDRQASQFVLLDIFLLPLEPRPSMVDFPGRLSSSML
jgi:hypothetical protein